MTPVLIVGQQHGPSTLQDELQVLVGNWATAQWYRRAIVSSSGNREAADMTKHRLSLVLWFYAGWTLGGMVSYLSGAPELIGPLVGVIVASFAELRGFTGSESAATTRGASIAPQRVQA